MRHVSRFIGVVVLTFAVPLGGLAHAQSAKPKAPADPPVAVDPMVLKDFQQRLEHYIKFQRGIEKDIGAKQKPVDDPQVINRKQETLAGTIRANRRNAKQGDIFTPQIANEFRRLLNPEVSDDAAPRSKRS